MTRFIFNYVRDLTDPASKPVAAGVLTTEDERFVSFEWSVDPESFEPSLFMREMVATFPDYLRILVDEDWPAYDGPSKVEGFNTFVCRCNMHCNLYVTRVEEDVPVRTSPDIPPGEWS